MGEKTPTSPYPGIVGDRRWRGWDLNPRHRAYESPALPSELPRHVLESYCVERSHSTRDAPRRQEFRLHIRVDQTRTRGIDRDGTPPQPVTFNR
jgi:hypothetical protein